MNLNASQFKEDLVHLGMFYYYPFVLPVSYMGGSKYGIWAITVLNKVFISSVYSIRCNFNNVLLTRKIVHLEHIILRFLLALSRKIFETKVVESDLICVTAMFIFVFNLICRRTK